MLSDLPNEIIMEIMKDLNPSQILTVGLTSEKFHTLSNDKYLWKFLIQRDFPHYQCPEEANKEDYILFTKDTLTARKLFEICEYDYIPDKEFNYFYDTRKPLFSFIRVGSLYYPEYDPYVSYGAQFVTMDKTGHISEEHSSYPELDKFYVAISGSSCSTLVFNYATGQLENALEVLRYLQRRNIIRFDDRCKY